MNASTTALGTLGIAVLAVVLDPVWRWSKRLVTLVHETGHTLVLWGTGHWVKSIGIESNGNGATTWAREAFWPVQVAVYFAGNAAPPVAGVLLAVGVARGWSPPAVIATILVLLVLVVLLHSDWHTLLVMALFGAGLAFFFWRAGPGAQRGLVITLAWFLLLGGLRMIMNAAGGAAPKGSDQAQLQRITSLHATGWVLIWMTIAVAAVVGGARALLY